MSSTPRAGDGHPTGPHLLPCPFHGRPLHRAQQI